MITMKFKEFKTRIDKACEATGKKLLFGWGFRDDTDIHLYPSTGKYSRLASKYSNPLEGFCKGTLSAHYAGNITEEFDCEPWRFLKPHTYKKYVLDQWPTRHMTEEEINHAIKVAKIYLSARYEINLANVISKIFHAENTEHFYSQEDLEAHNKELDLKVLKFCLAGGFPLIKIKHESEIWHKYPDAKELNPIFLENIDPYYDMD